MSPVVHLYLMLRNLFADAFLLILMADWSRGNMEAASYDTMPSLNTSVMDEHSRAKTQRPCHSHVSALHLLSFQINKAVSQHSFPERLQNLLLSPPLLRIPDLFCDEEEEKIN